MALSDEEAARLYEEFLDSQDPRMIASPTRGAPKVEIGAGSTSSWMIWEGYLEAAGLLLVRAMDSEALAQRLIFPAIFNLRHGIEIALKWHITYAGGIVPKRAGHNLDLLIEIFRQTAEGLDDDANYLPEYVLSCAAEIASLDPRAVAFRYPSDLGGAPIKPSSEAWDLSRLLFTVETISLCFEGLDGKIDLSRNEDCQVHLGPC